MRKIFKRFKLSEWLLLGQLIFSTGTLLLTTVLGDSIVDVVGLVGNIINGIALLVVFGVENSRNIKYYELTGQFIFNKMGENFSAFMDFLMSEEYRKMPFDEHNILEEKLVHMAKTGEYDVKRKISRAFPNLYEVDRKMAMELMEILREDIYNDRTDIRRRTLEAMLTIIQKEPKQKKRKKLAKRFEEFFSYRDYDDSYTVVACIENYYFLHDYVYTDKDDQSRCKEAFEKLKTDAKSANAAQLGAVETVLCEDMDTIWQVLSALSTLRDVTNEGFREKQSFVERILAEGLKFSKLTVVKNLFYTCKNFPECLRGKSCTASGSRFMMEKINHFLTNALDQDVFLVMPTVRYFDCVSNNICRSEAKESARSIIREYFSSDELLIAQTAFDKFAKLMEKDADFGREVLRELLEEEQAQAQTQSRQIQERIEALPQEQKAYFQVLTGRLKFKPAGNTTHRQRSVRSAFDDVKQIDTMIRSYHERIRFIGKIKKYKEDHAL